MRNLLGGLAAVLVMVGCGDSFETGLFESGGAGGSDAGGSSGSGANAGSANGGDAGAGGGQSSGGSSAGSAGFSAGGSANGGSANGGSANGGSASGGSAGSANGGSAGAATGGSANGGSAGAATGGSANGGNAGAATGGSANGGSAGATTGGSGGGTTVSCELTPGTAHPALYTTLNDDAAITSPIYGDPTGVTYAGDGFREGHCQTGYRIVGSDSHVSYRQVKGGYQNFEYTHGTLAFWFLPEFSHTDGKNHHLFASNDPGRWNNSGGIRIRKAASDNGNAFQVIAVAQGNPAPAIYRETTVASADYSFVKSRWVHIKVSWDFRVTSVLGQNVRVYFDGVQPPYASTTSGLVNFPAESEEAKFFIGAWGVPDVDTAGGVVDEFMLWTDVVP